MIRSIMLLILVFPIAGVSHADPIASSSGWTEVSDPIRLDSTELHVQRVSSGGGVASVLRNFSSEPLWVTEVASLREGPLDPGATLTFNCHGGEPVLQVELAGTGGSTALTTIACGELLILNDAGDPDLDRRIGASQ